MMLCLELSSTAGAPAPALPAQPGCCCPGCSGIFPVHARPHPAAARRSWGWSSRAHEPRAVSVQDAAASVIGHCSSCFAPSGSCKSLGRDLSLGCQGCRLTYLCVHRWEGCQLEHPSEEHLEVLDTTSTTLTSSAKPTPHPCLPRQAPFPWWESLGGSSR